MTTVLCEASEMKPTPSDVEAMTLAVRESPADETLRCALRDAIQETGVSGATAERRVAKIVRDAEDRARSPKSVKRWLRGSIGLDGIRAALDVANGRRRERTLSVEDVIDAVARVRTGKLAWRAVGGGTVANAYGYRSWQTACLIAVRTDGSLRIAIGTTSGSGGASLTNWASGLTARATDAQFRAWADADRVPPPESAPAV